MSEAETVSASATVKTYARIAGLLFIVSIVAGGFGEGYAPAQLIVANDAAATVANLEAKDALHRLSFAAYLVEALCDIGIAVIFYFLLEPVNRVLALLAMAFGILSTALYAACEIFYFGLPHVLLGGADYLKTFTPDQLHSLTLASLRLFNHGAGLFLIFYGVGWIIRGSLMVRSRYFPKVLGLLMIAGGLGFVAHTVALVLAPGLATPFLLFLMAPGGVLLGLWLLIRGINVAQFEAAAKAAAVQI